MNAWQFFAKWAAIILLLVVIAKTEIGNRILYYAIWLIILYLLVTHPQDISNVLNPGGTDTGS